MSKPVSKTPAKPPRKPAAKAGSASTSGQTQSDASPKPSKNILTAGIKALTHVHEEAVARQSRVFESLLGLGAKKPAEGTNDVPAPALDPFGFRKFEDVFDQRVARAMENLQVPTAQAFAALMAEVERLRETVARLEAQARKR